MPAAAKKRIKRRWGAPWTLAELKRLGKTPDSVLARHTGRTIREVVAMREHRRIRLVTAPRRWTAREIKLLGRFTDAELSRRLRRSYETVRRQRRILHIPALRPLRWRLWTRAEEKLVGKIPDKELARRLDRSLGAIKQRRISLGILPRPFLESRQSKTSGGLACAARSKFIGRFPARDRRTRQPAANLTSPSSKPSFHQRGQSRFTSAATVLGAERENCRPLLQKSNAGQRPRRFATL